VLDRFEMYWKNPLQMIAEVLWVLGDAMRNLHLSVGCSSVGDLLSAFI